MGTLTSVDLLQASRTQLLDDVLVRLCQTVQLSPTQFSLAESHYHAICEWLGQEGSELSAYSPDLYPQGSVALGTTVKPLMGEEYDVDLVCELNINYRSVHDPVILLDMIERRMRQSDLYKDKLKRKRRCLRVNYEHDFHLDILPACPDQGTGQDCLVVPDREDKRWRASNPKGFVKWFKIKGALRPAISFSKMAMDSAAPLPQPQTAEQKTTLQLSVQLIKRWRDVHYAENIESAPVSIVLTTLMGDKYQGIQSVSENIAFSTQAIIDAVPAQGRLIVVNPSHPQEDISERWADTEKYAAFVSGMKALRQQMVELASAQDMGRQSKLLQKMFGDVLTKKAYETQARSIQAARDSQKMGVARSATGIVSLAASSALVSPVPKNTFYGDR